MGFLISTLLLVICHADKINERFTDLKEKRFLKLSSIHQNKTMILKLNRHVTTNTPTHSHQITLIIASNPALQSFHYLGKLYWIISFFHI